MKDGVSKKVGERRWVKEEEKEAERGGTESKTRTPHKDAGNEMLTSEVQDL